MNMNERLLKLFAVFFGLTGGGYAGYVFGAWVSLAASTMSLIIYYPFLVIPLALLKNVLSRSM